MGAVLFRVFLSKIQYRWQGSLCHNRRFVSLPQTDFLVTDTDTWFIVSVEDITDGILGGTAAGIMGLAFQSIASTKALPFWQALVNGGLFTSPQMSFWLTRFLNNGDVQTEEPGGVLTLGGSNTTLYTGDIEFLDMPSGTPSFWLLQMSGACSSLHLFLQ
jgi:hypothetical protein